MKTHMTWTADEPVAKVPMIKQSAMESLGILELENKPIDIPGGLSAPDSVRQDTGLPVTDCVSVARMLMETSPPQG